MPRPLAAALALLLTTPAAGGIWDSHIATHLGTDDGLQSDFVRGIVEGADHLPIVATYGGGTMRYDGYDFARVVRGGNNFVRCLSLDARGRLWIGDERGLRPPGEYADRQSRPVGMPSGQVTALAPLTDKWMLAVVGNSLVVMPQEATAGSLSVTPCLLERPNGVLTAQDGRAFLGVGGEVHEVHVGDDGTPWLTRVNTPEQAFGNVVEALLLDADTLWIGTDGGLAKTLLTTGQTRVWQHDPADDNSLSQNRITALAQSPNPSHLLVGTLLGLNVLHRGSGRCERVLATNPASRTSLASNFITSLCPTPRGLWIGYDGAGVDYLAPKALDAHAIPIATLFPGLTGQHPVNSILAARGKLYVGAIEAGLAVGTPTPDGLSWRALTTAHGLPHNSVSCLAELDGQLYAGTWGGGLCRLDAGERVERLGGLNSDFVGALMADTLNRGVWVATTSDVAFVTPDRHVTRPLPEEVTANMTGALGAAIDDYGRLWLGISSGLLVIDLHSLGQHTEWHLYRHALDNANDPSTPRVTHLLYSRTRHAMVVCTNGDGVYIVPDRPGQPDVEHYTTYQGLANDCAVAAAEDSLGNLYISTSHGLSKLQLNPLGLHNYSQSDGLQDNSYFWNASATTPCLGVVLGGATGLTAIGTRQPYGQTDLTPPIITELALADSLLSHAPNTLSAIHIGEGDGLLRISLATQCFETAADVQFRLRLSGVDGNWEELPRGQHTTSFAHLPGGSHTLDVQYVAAGGLLSPIRQLTIVVTPVFYKTWWFAALCAAAAALLVWLIVLARTRYLRRTRRELQEQVRLRTARIARQNEQLEEQTEELQRQNEALTEQKRELVDLTARVQRLTADKLQFFTNVSHELRSPLTLIQGPLRHARQLLREPRGEDDTAQADQMLQLAEDNAAGLLRTVNQLLDFRKADTLSLELHPVADRLDRFVRQCAEPYEAYAADQGTRLRVYTRLSQPTLRFDHDAMSKLVVNLLSNALKYGGHDVALYCGTALVDGRRQTYLCCSDRGMGVPEKQLDGIFERFQGSGPHEPGVESSGLGLYLVKSLVVQMGGEIGARNNRPHGLAVRILLPLESTPASPVAPATGPDGATASAERDTHTHGDPANVQDTTQMGAATSTPDATQDTTSGATLDAAPGAPPTAGEDATQGAPPTAGEDDALDVRPTVLVVDDNEQMRRFIRTVLAPRHTVIEASNGLDALLRMAEKDVDIVLTDLMMPGMDGLELARRVKGDTAYSHIPVVILTASANDDFRTTGYRVGVESYLHKPFDEQMLLARIEGILKGRHEAQHKYQLTLDPADLNIERKTADERFAEQVTDLIRRRYGDSELRIEDFVKATGYSKSLLHKKTHSLMGSTPGDLLRTYRLQAARKLLSGGGNDLNVKQVAFEVGFNDPRYFARCYQQAFGMLPSEARNRGGGDADPLH